MIGTFSASPGRWLDLRALDTFQVLRDAFAEIASGLGLADVDLSAVTGVLPIAGEERRFTQAGLRVFWERLVGPRVDTAVWDGDLNFQAARLHHVRAREQRGTSRAVIPAMYPRAPSISELDQVDFLLPLVLNDDRGARARTLALRWYEKGIRADAPVDKLLSYFVAIEALVTAFADQNGPVPQEQERRSRLDEIRERLINLGPKAKGYGRRRARSAWHYWSKQRSASDLTFTLTSVGSMQT